MPVRIRITVLFSLLVSVILTLVCVSVYYFSYNSRITTIRTRLANRAITTGNLLNQSTIFSNELVRKIDSSTTMAYTNKVIQAYDYRNNKIYEYSDIPNVNLRITDEVLNEARINGRFFFTIAR